MHARFRWLLWPTSAALIPLTLMAQTTPGGSLHPPLTPGVSVERTLSVGEVHSYQVRLAAGEYFRASVQERNVALHLTILTLDGEKLRITAGWPPAPSQGRRNFTFVAPVSGVYRLDLSVDTAGPAVVGGQYELRFEEVLTVSQRLERALVPRAPRPPINARLLALQKELNTDDGALERFWHEVKERGAPLVEPIPGDDTNRRVTFLWQATYETHNVLVVWPLPNNPSTPQNPVSDDLVMTRLPSTDVWYKTLVFPLDARLNYRFSVNDPLVVPTFLQAITERQATFALDPLNPRRRFVEGPFALDPSNNASVFELQGEPRWITRDVTVPKGKIEHRVLRSDILKDERNVSVYASGDYRRGAAGQKLIVFLDGPEYLEEIRTPVILDNLRAAGRIPPMIAVFIHHKDRRAEANQNVSFANFLANELVPWIRREYGLWASARDAVVGGFSGGGQTAAFTGLRHSDVFGNVLAQSGGFFDIPSNDPKNPLYTNVDFDVRDNWMAKQFIGSRKLPLRFYLDVGLYELSPNGLGWGLTTTRQFRDVLQAKGYEVHYQEFAGGHSPLSWRATLADGILALIGVTAAKPR